MWHGGAVVGTVLPGSIPRLSVCSFQAPCVFERRVSPKVTSGMVISTFLSAPIMYVSAWLLTIPLMDPTPLVTELENVSFNISIVSLVALVCTPARAFLQSR